MSVQMCVYATMYRSQLKEQKIAAIYCLECTKCNVTGCNTAYLENFRVSKFSKIAWSFLNEFLRLAKQSSLIKANKTFSSS